MKASRASLLKGSWEAKAGVDVDATVDIVVEVVTVNVVVDALAVDVVVSIVPVVFIYRI